MFRWKWASVLLALLIMPGAAATSWRQMPASELLARPVLNAQGVPVGEIEDLVLDLERGLVYYAIVRSAGWAGADARYHAVPVQALKPARAGRALLDLDFDAVPELPQFGADWQPRRGVRASDLLNRPARSARNGLFAGEIEDVIVDLQRARVVHLLFDRAGRPDGPPVRLAPRAFALPARGEGEALVKLR